MVGVPADLASRFPGQYPWINKGYIIVGAALLKGGSGLATVFLEMVTEGEVGPQKLSKGAQAVYIHDGRFLLIEAVVSPEDIDAPNPKYDLRERRPGDDELLAAYKQGTMKYRCPSCNVEHPGLGPDKEDPHGKG